MRIKRLVTGVVCGWWLGLGCLFAGGKVQAADSLMADDIRQQSLMEYSKGVLVSSVTSGEDTEAVQGGSAEYDREGRQLANQLQIVADNEETGYNIVNGDTLTIGYQDRDKFSRAAYKVSEQGEIYFPLVGPVKVAGLNRRQARERVEVMLKEYIREPRVVIGVNTDGRVMIFGAVSNPGLFLMKSRLSVMEAIFQAGGFNRDTAEMASVVIIRGSVEHPTLLKLNLKKMITRGDRTDDILVKPGDFIYIPTTMISSLEKFWDRANGFLMRWYGLGGKPPLTNGNWNWGGP